VRFPWIILCGHRRGQQPEAGVEIDSFNRAFP
jgi:hypothetical protein